MRKDYDFSKARRARDIPHLAKLQDEAKGKTRITIMLDSFVIEAFRTLAEREGIGYQTLINRTLREQLTNQPLSEDDLRRVIREELAANVTRNR
jgi:uncharacterized protein (DUF4415 family)